MARGRPLSAAAGLAVLAAWGSWVLVAGAWHGDAWKDSLRYVLLPPVFVGGMLLGRWMAGQRRDGAAALALITAGVLLCSVTVWGGPGGGLLGYSNANAALALQLLALAALTAAGAQVRARRLALLAGGVAVTAVLVTLSRAGGALLIPVMGAALLAVTRGVRARWWPMAVGPTCAGVVAGGVVWLAGRHSWPLVASLAFDDVRRALWADALELWAVSPVVGSGPGSFRAFSPMAADADTQRAHMSLLQVGSELGLVGVTLFALMIAVAYVLASRGSPSAALIAVTAVSALLIHSFVDHVLEFPAVLLTAGAVVGWAGREPG